MRAAFALLISGAGLLCAGEVSNRRAPGFSLPDSSLRQHDSQDYRGKILLVDIMKTGCEHCGRFSEILEEVTAKYKDKVAVLSIVTPPDTQTTVAKYIADHKLKSPILFDCGQVTASYLKVTPQNPTFHVPHIFIIDAQGVIRNEFAYEPATREIFEGRAIFAELDRMLGRGR